MCALSLWTWGAGVSDLTADAARKVPMAPSTGILLGLASLCLWCLWRGRRHPDAFRFIMMAVPLIGAGGALVFVGHALGWDSPLEAWLACPAHGREDLGVGRMSAATGAATFGVAVCLWLLARAMQRGSGSPSSLIIGSLLVIFEGSVTVFYLVGGHWPWRGLASPVALWTAMVLVLLGVAIVTNAWGSAGRGEYSRGTEVVWRRSFGPWGAAAAVAVGMSVLGAFYLRHEQVEIRLETAASLQALARSKAAQIASWRGDRLEDADLFTRSSMVARSVEEFLNDPLSAAAKADVLNLLGLLKGSTSYSSADFYDAEFQPFAAVSGENATANGVLRALMLESQRQRHYLMSDLYRCGECGGTHQSIVLPLFSPGPQFLSGNFVPSSLPTLETRLLGWVILRLDPQLLIYPLLQNPLSVGQTAELLLVRRENDKLVFLSEPRHDPSLQFAALNSDFSEHLASGNPYDFGSDYRGRSVMAASCTVRGTSWKVVAKVDWGEIHEAVHEKAWLVLALTVLLSAAGGLLTRLILKQRETEYVRSELALERQRAALSERVEGLMKMATDSILLADQQDRIVEVNDQVLKDYGYTWPELRSMKLPQLRAPGARTSYHDQSREIVRDGRMFFETLHQRKDGTLFPVEIHSRVIAIDGLNYRLGIIRDITERKKAEEGVRASLKEKEVLLKEVHHRVKNNLQLISSLLHLQAAQEENASARPILQDTQARIRSMSLLHEALYRSDNFSQVDFGRYMQSLVVFLRGAIPSADRVEFWLHFEGAHLDLNVAVPCGLIVNELVTNSLKHAFLDGQPGLIQVELKGLGEQRFSLRVADNGPGLPEDLDLSQAQTLGLQLVHDLIRQIGGSLERHPGPGTGFKITFSAKGKS